MFFVSWEDTAADTIVEAGAYNVSVSSFDCMTLAACSCQDKDLVPMRFVFLDCLEFGQIAYLVRCVNKCLELKPSSWLVISEGHCHVVAN